MTRAPTHSKPDAALYAADMVKRLLLGVEEFRTNLSARIKAMTNDEHTVLAMRGKPIGVLVPIEWYRKAAEKLREPTEF